jgi:hypothetical protein
MFLNALRVVAAGLLVAGFAPGGPAAPVPADRVKADKELATLSAKLHGAWLGDEGCVGRLTLRPDGTYEWRFRGPGGETDTGTWLLRGDPAQPTLALACKTSDDPDREGKTAEAKLAKLAERNFELKYANSSQPQRFSRAKCGVMP